MGTDHADRRRLASETQNPSSLARPALCRYSPKVGAQCVNCARWDLCGGHRVTGIPTAILGRLEPRAAQALARSGEQLARSQRAAVRTAALRLWGPRHLTNPCSPRLALYRTD
jgi:hypothetical protein